MAAVSGYRLANTMDRPDIDGWVRETRFGVWFQGTKLWNRHVLEAAFDDVEPLLRPSDRVRDALDIGCGEGRAFPLIDRRFHPDRIIGVDVDPELVALGAGAAEGCEARVQVRRGDAASLDLPDGSVDLVFCHQTFHHLTYQERAAREFYRVLRPGGLLLFVESCRAFVWSLWVRLLFRHPMHVQRSAGDYMALLREAGFVIEPDDVALPYPPWSRPALGMAKLFGQPAPDEHDAPLVCAAARRPR